MNESYKLELIESFDASEEVSIYKQAESGLIFAEDPMFKRWADQSRESLEFAGSYWRTMRQTTAAIYGTAFSLKKISMSAKP